MSAVKKSTMATVSVIPVEPKKKAGGRKRPKPVARDGNGDFIRTPAAIALDQRAAEMRSRSMTYAQIGQALDVVESTAYRMVMRAMADVPREGGAQMLALELAKLDFLERRHLAILQREHFVVSAGGKIVHHEGQPMVDDGPALAAMAGLLRVADRRAKLLGLNAPVRTEVTGSMTVESSQHAADNLFDMLGVIMLNQGAADGN